MSLEINNFTVFGGLLIAGLVGGHLAARTRHLPRITGMILVGLLIGPSGAGILDEGMLADSRVFVDLALGLILFQLGLTLDLRTLSRDRATLWAAALEALVTFISILAALAAVGVDLLHASLAAAIGVSSSPAVLLMVVRDLDAHGPVTDRALRLVALNNFVAFALYTAILPFVHYQQQVGWFTVLVTPVVQVIGAIGLALMITLVLIRAARWILSPHSDSFPLVVGFVLLALGLATMLNLSLLLTLLALGVFVRNLETHKRLVEVHFGRGGELFFLILFVVAGANLHLSELWIVGGAALAFVLARVAGKWFTVFAVSRIAGLTVAQSSATGLALVPMAGLAIGLVQSTQSLYPGFGELLSAIVLAAVAILETIGPVATEYALKIAGEVDSDESVQH